MNFLNRKKLCSHDIASQYTTVKADFARIGRQEKTSLSPCARSKPFSWPRHMMAHVQSSRTGMISHASLAVCSSDFSRRLELAWLWKISSLPAKTLERDANGWCCTVTHVAIKLFWVQEASRSGLQEFLLIDRVFQRHTLGQKGRCLWLFEQACIFASHSLA